MVDGPLKIAVVNTYEAHGGAARAAQRLHRALTAAGAASTMVVAARSSDDPTVLVVDRDHGLLADAARWMTRRQTAELDQRFLRGGGDANEPLRLDRATGYGALPSALRGADVVNLHWVANFVDAPMVSALAKTVAPVVWTMHDMLPMTGGCHYDAECGRYTVGCGCCPKLTSSSAGDATSRTYRRKHSAVGRIASGRLHVVTPSRWLAACVQRAPIFSGVPASVIPNAIDTESFRPQNKSAARAAYDIPADAKVILFMSQGLATARKGIDQLIDALSSIDRVQAEDMLLLAVGSGQSEFRLPMAQRIIGEVARDDALGTLYAAADIVVIPSRQDNLPNTMVEAMACGTPVIGFAVGGIPDLVRHDETGLLVPPADVAALRNAIQMLLADPDRRQRMGKSCRDLILKECHPSVQASRYLDLFAGLARREMPANMAGRRRAG